MICTQEENKPYLICGSSSRARVLQGKKAGRLHFVATWLSHKSSSLWRCETSKVDYCARPWFRVCNVPVISCCLCVCVRFSSTLAHPAYYGVSSFSQDKDPLTAKRAGQIVMGQINVWSIAASRGAKDNARSLRSRAGNVGGSLRRVVSDSELVKRTVPSLSKVRRCSCFVWQKLYSELVVPSLLLHGTASIRVLYNGGTVPVGGWVWL